jgi:hypothetical protein
MLVREVLAALMKSETALFAGIPCTNEDLRFAGMIGMLHSMCDVEVSAVGYFGALAAVLRSEGLPMAGVAAQLLFARILGPAFHGLDVIGLAQLQADRGCLQAPFAEAVLRVFGIAAVRRLVVKYLRQFMETFDDGGRPVVAVVVPYLRFCPVHTQIELHAFLVGQCERRRFDSELFELTAAAIRESAPAVSPSLGRFLEISRKSVTRAAVLAALRPLLVPAGPPPQQQLSGMLVLPDELKTTAESQMTPECRAEAVQTD